MSSSGDVDHAAQWSSQIHCFCDKSHFKCFCIEHIEVPMWVGRQTEPNNNTEASITRLSHDCIVVKYSCHSCKRSNQFVTYELTRNGKQARAGTYGLRLATGLKGHRHPSRSYEYVEGVFDRMPGHYNVATHNCAHWAESFFFQLS